MLLAGSLAASAPSLSKEPTIRVSLGYCPKEFTIGSVGKFALVDSASSKQIFAGEGDVKCVINDAAAVVFSLFIDTFYTYDDANKFGATLSARFPENTPLKIVLIKNLYSLEIGEYATEEEAKTTLATLLSDIPKASVVASNGNMFSIDGKLALRPQADSQTSTEYIKIVPEKDDMPRYKGKRYKGSLALVMHKGRMIVVNTLPFEEYLKGVVPVEMPASWNIEAVKAQTIAARTYAIRTIDPSKDTFDICSDTSCQVYLGFDHESPNSNLAIAQTRGMVATHSGKFIDAVFHSTSGGHTENSENVFSSARPYLKGVPSPDEESAKTNWFVSFDYDDFCARIKPALATDIGDIIDWKNVKLGVSGRVVRAEVIGTQGKAEIGGGKTRTLLNLNDNWFDVIFIPGMVVVAGHGWGHGCGMSQYGAKAMADKGAKYDKIIKYYFTGVEIVKWY